VVSTTPRPLAPTSVHLHRRDDPIAHPRRWRPSRFKEIVDELRVAQLPDAPNRRRVTRSQVVGRASKSAVAPARSLECHLDLDALRAEGTMKTAGHAVLAPLGN
jgi:hypothetical protein